MRQFEVYPNPSERSRPAIPFVVVLQSHFLEAMQTVVVAPILIDDGKAAFTEVSVRVELDGADHVVSVAEIVAIESKRLQRVSGDLSEYEGEIRPALERLFTGF